MPPARDFEELFRQTHERLFGALCLVTGDRHEAEEVMQDAYLKIWERWERVSLMDEPTGYLFTVALNLSRSRRRRASLALRKAQGSGSDPDDLANVEDRDEVTRALDGLPRVERAAIILTTMFGFSSEEAGRLLGAKPATVRAYAARARASVRARAGGSP